MPADLATTAIDRLIPLLPAAAQSGTYVGPQARAHELFDAVARPLRWIDADQALQDFVASPDHDQPVRERLFRALAERPEFVPALTAAVLAAPDAWRVADDTDPADNSLPAARAGQLTCIEDGCANQGAALAYTHCPRCGSPTVVVPPEDTADGAPLARLEASPGISAGNMIGRIVFGGFWTLVTLGLIVVGFESLAKGRLSSLLSLGIALLTGLYARYLFRGGRFRIFFW